jgi:LacI family transcriptional regulator
MTRKSTSVTIRDVAKHAGVSVATISRYINQNAPVSQEVSERISQVMLDLSYAPHAAARHLATRRMRTIGLVLHNMHTDFFAPLLSGIEQVVSENQYNLLVATYKASVHSNNQPPLGPHNTDGMLVFADSLSEEQLTQLCRDKFPIVLIHRAPPSYLKIPYVTVENKAATRKIIDHLIDDHGRRSILFLRGPYGQEDSCWREQGYISSLEAHNIPFDSARVLDGEFDGSVAYRAVKNYLAKNNASFDAVFTGNDDAAVGVLTALTEAGLRVPEDVAVAGFDDSRLAPFLNPPLTTVRAPTQEVGRIVTKQLFSLLQKEAIPQETLLPTEIILRRSCGCEHSLSTGS